MGSRSFQDDPNMSDTTILVKLEDLINIAMGPPNKNTVNFKLLQTILHILARQMRALGTNVELRVQEIKDMSPERKSSDRKSPRKKAHDSATTDDSSGTKKKEKKEKDHDTAHKKGDKETSIPEKEAEQAKEREAGKHKETVKGEKGKGKEGKSDRDKHKETAKVDKGKESAKVGKHDEDKAAKSEKGKHQDTHRAGKDDGGRHARSVSRGREKSSATSITVTEKQRDKEKVLVVEKGPLSRGSRTKVGSIEVVTQDQFTLLEAAVNALKSIAGPIPVPELPDNEKLRSELASGSASLPDTMEAMQVTARLKAAEEAIGRMAGLLTALSAAGALPEDLLDKFGGPFDDDMGTTDAIDAMSTHFPTPKTVAIDSMSIRPSSPSHAEPSRKSLAARHSSAAKSSATSKAASLVSRASVASKQSAATTEALVTHPEMDDALLNLKELLSKNVANMTSKASSAADTALNTTRVVAEKLEVALKLNSRISTLNSMVTDYAEQLSGFDAGLTTQMSSFQEQMAQMRSDLKDGLTQLEQVNNNAETAAIMELTERHGELMSELDRTVFTHQGLAAFQKQLGDELHSLIECVETLQEQKADRDEVLDGLRDKADNNRLAGLLTEAEFALAKDELDKRLEVCYEKFKRQETVWMLALSDLKHVAETKAQLIQLLGMKEDTQQELQELRELLDRLAVILGEPKAAILTRKLAKDASCGVCLAPAMMEPTDANYGAPPPLPAMRPKPVGASDDEPEPCLIDWKPPQPADSRDHTCHRWVGGSHTLVSGSLKREQAPPLNIQATPTKKYAGYGSDGRMYMMEDELEPCIECNVLKPDHEVSVPPLKTLVESGAGDQG